MINLKEPVRKSRTIKRTVKFTVCQYTLKNAGLNTTQRWVK